VSVLEPLTLWQSLLVEQKLAVVVCVEDHTEAQQQLLEPLSQLWLREQPQEQL
jgi:hypothetical protein